MNHKLITGLEAGLISCHHCEFVSRLEPGNPHNQRIICPRCDAELHTRIPNSLAKTTALLLAAILMYIPANILPIMNVTYLGTGQSDTIIQGILHLMKEGMWPLALIVFVASIIVPLLKLTVLAGLIISIKMRSHWRPAQRTRLFRITEFVGRWSMVDIFVLAILVALVQFGNLASVDAGLGALSFALVVILTMLAAHSFDTRLIWDAINRPDNPAKIVTHITTEVTTEAATEAIDKTKTKREIRQ